VVGEVEGCPHERELLLVHHAHRIELPQHTPHHLPAMAQSPHMRRPATQHPSLCVNMCKRSWYHKRAVLPTTLTTLRCRTIHHIISRQYPSSLTCAGLQRKANVCTPSHGLCLLPMSACNSHGGSLTVEPLTLLFI